MLDHPPTPQESRQLPPTAPPGAMPTPTRAAPPPRTRTRNQRDQGTPEPCSPLKRSPRRPRSSTDYRADAKEVPLNITQKRRPGLRAFLRVPKAQEVHQTARRQATSPLPPTLGSSRDGHPRHGSEVGSWEQTSPCCRGQSHQIPVRLSTTQQDRGECGQETFRIAFNIPDTPVSAQRPRHGLHRRGCRAPLQMAQRDDRLWPYRPPKGSRRCREVGGVDP